MSKYISDQWPALCLNLCSEPFEFPQNIHNVLGLESICPKKRESAQLFIAVLKNRTEQNRWAPCMPALFLRSFFFSLLWFLRPPEWDFNTCSVDILHIYQIVSTWGIVSHAVRRPRIWALQAHRLGFRPWLCPLPAISLEKSFNLLRA